MKKILMILVMTAGATGLFAQQTTPKKDKEVKKTEVAKTSAKKEENKTAPATKKDGTPDMRFKENKEKTKPAGPTKKDGTPDKRYKENKEKDKGKK